MAALKDIKRKIKGIQKTRQITKAMNMVAASKFKAAHLRMENVWVYASRLASLHARLINHVDLKGHALFTSREPVRLRVILITSDRGLCGSFNTNLIKFADKFIKEKVNEGKDIHLTTVGRKGRDFFQKIISLPSDTAEAPGFYDMPFAAGLMDRFLSSFINADFDELYLIYNRFVNISLQKPVCQCLLPLRDTADSSLPDQIDPDHIYEPSIKLLLDKLLPLRIHTQFYQALLETLAGENGARMVAMDNATKNCDDMSRSLTLKYNKARQAAITAELMDIVGGAEALAQT